MVSNIKRGIILFIVFLLGASLVSAEIWQEQESGTDFDMYDVHMVDQRLGWAVGGNAFDGGVILYTEDGLEWDTQFTSSDALYGVCFFDRETGWAVGGSSLVYYTRNGGEDWLPFDLTYDVSFWDVHCVGDEAFAVGNGDYSVIKFVDEGHIPLEEGYSLKGAYFLDEDTGYAVGDAGTVLYTEDGSEFELVATVSEGGLNEVFCLDRDSCWIVGSGNTLYVGSVGSWDEETAGTIVSGYWAVYYNSDDEGWLGGQNTIRHLEDGDWVSQRAEVDGRTSSSIPVNMVKDVQFVSDIGWAVGDEGLILSYREEELVCEEVENDCPMFFEEVYDEVTGCLIDYFCFEGDLCPEVEELECDDGWSLIELVGEDGCVEGYLCQENIGPFVAVEVTCQDQYRECLEEMPFNHAECDGTYEFCEGIDEILDEFLNEGGQDEAIREMLRADELTDYMEGEEANLHIMRKDGSEWVISLDVSKKGEVIIGNELIEGANYNVYLDEEMVDKITNSANVKETVRNGLKDKSIVVKASGFKAKMKLGFVKIFLLFS